jgi:transcriptional regulator with XRE-family HTH domain
MTPGDRIRKAREALGLTREEMAERLEGYSPNRIYDLEVGRTKLTERIASQISYTFGLSYRWLLDETGKMMADVQYMDNLRLQLFERGVLSKGEWEMIELLRAEEIKEPSTPRTILDAWKGMTKMVAETTKVKYKTSRGKR